MNKQNITHLNSQSAGTVVVTGSQMKEIERMAAEEGLSYYQMMENAGAGAVEHISSQYSASGKTVFVFCGKGNNGGDGFVAARKLKEKGASVKVFLVEGEPKTEDALKNYKICQGMDIPIYNIGDWDENKNDSISAADIIIDAIYGTGFHGELREPVRKIIRQINALEAVVYALDIPSGLNGDNGVADQDTVRADETIVFHCLKPAHINEAATKYCGRVSCISIGIEKVHPFA